MIAARASAFDMLEALDDQGRRPRLTRQRFGEMARQVSEGPSVTLRDEAGRLAVVAGLWPEADHWEAWFAVGPAFRPNLRRALGQLEHLLTVVAGSGESAEVRVYVRPGDRVAGKRMASWLGFTTVGIEGSPIGPVEVFTRTFGGRPDAAG